MVAVTADPAEPRTGLRAALGRRAVAWSRRRTGVDQSPVELTRRRVYILPTGLGLTYAVMLFTMLLAGLNYANNLALILTFVLTATGWVAMHECHRNLLGLRIALGATRPPFAGQPAGFCYQVVESAGRARYDLSFSVEGAEPALLSLVAQSAHPVTLAVPTHQRGRVHVRRVRVESCFPLGLCRAWSWLHVEQNCVVYPNPAEVAEAVAGGAGEPSTGTARPVPGDDDWSGLRNYQRGDPLRRLAWKAYARSGVLLVKEMCRESTAPLCFDWDQTPGRDTEERVSRLARLVVDAAARGDSYRLNLPGGGAPYGRDAAHRHRCLALLANFRAPRETANAHD